jgi:hypothetical protein
MGVFTEVSRFFQQIESPTVTRQFRLVVQDYGKEKNLEPELRKAWRSRKVHTEGRNDRRRQEGFRRHRPFERQPDDPSPS